MSTPNQTITIHQGESIIDINTFKKLGLSPSINKTIIVEGMGNMPTIIKKAKEVDNGITLIKSRINGKGRQAHGSGKEENI